MINSNQMNLKDALKDVLKDALKEDKPSKQTTNKAVN